MSDNFDKIASIKFVTVGSTSPKLQKSFVEANKIALICT